MLTAAGPCLIWSGLLLGGSVAAVAKFRAEDVARDALGRVGRVQFAALRRAEALLAAGALGLNAASADPRAAAAPLGLAVAVAAVQAGFVVPWVRREKEKFGDRGVNGEKGGKGVSTVMAGAHGVQVVLELVKLGTCVYVSFVAR